MWLNFKGRKKQILLTRSCDRPASAAQRKSWV